MNAQKAHSLGIRYEDVEITTVASHQPTLGGPLGVWTVWVPNPGRPGGRQVLTQGHVFYCAQWYALLKRYNDDG